MDRGRSLTSTIPSVGSGTYSPGPNMARSPDEEGSNEECRCHHGPGLPRPQKPCYSVEIMEHIYALFDRRCWTQTALGKLKKLRHWVKRFRWIGDTLKKVFS